MRRPLEPNERDVLLRMLDEDFEGANELRRQVSGAVVIGGTPPTWLYLEVDDQAQASNAIDGPIPVDAWAYNSEGEAIGTLLVWVKEGRLSAIEFGWVTDDKPTSFPALDTVKISQKD